MVAIPLVTTMLVPTPARAASCFSAFPSLQQQHAMLLRALRRLRHQTLCACHSLGEMQNGDLRARSRLAEALRETVHAPLREASDFQSATTTGTVYEVSRTNEG